MKTFAFLTAAAIAVSTPSLAWAQDENLQLSATQMALAREVIDLGFPPETRMDTMVGVADQLIGQLMASNPSLKTDPKLRAVMDRFRQRVVAVTRETLAVHIDGMMEAMAQAYAESFTAGELAALHAFVSTPEGRGMLTRMSDINSHPTYAAANQAYINDYMLRVPGLQQELMQDVADTMRESGSGKAD